MTQPSDPHRSDSQASLPAPEVSTHFDSQGRARMVDVGSKEITQRRATAVGYVVMQAETLAAILAGALRKGDVLQVARIAGIQAAKQTGHLIPLCHPLPLDAVTVDLKAESPTRLKIEAQVAVTAKTGVEMEALTAVSVAALTVYDMVKSIDRELMIEGICLVAKSGGRSGEYRRTPSSPAT